MERVTSTFARRYEADPESVGRARAELAHFASRAGASPTLVDGVRLAVSEAVTNAVRHAYPLDPGEVRVRALVGEDALEVVVSDDGCGVHRDRSADGGGASGRGGAPGHDGTGEHHRGTNDGGLGFGLALICEVSDQMTLGPRSDGGTDVRMRFSLLESGSGAAVGRL
jgi:anti-sigma regulatory factor (Ser/Thr protein kinase)